jgi:pyruvate,water dikinase
LDPKTQAVIRSGEYENFEKLVDVSAFHLEFQDFTDEFGHMSDRTGVFDTVPWRETPEIILQLISTFEPVEDPIRKGKRFADVKLGGLRGQLQTVFYERARQFYLLREKYSSLYTYTLMLFRVYYLRIGKHMVDQDLLAVEDDVYYLYDEEIRAYAKATQSTESFQNLVKQRKAEIERCRDALTPEIIFGDTPPPLVIERDQKLTGTPTSRGYHTGTARLVRGINDFSKVVKGDVLVIPYSDVGWVPLFAKAGAVVSESGGMLSHSSIVAREYGIPAVVSVNGALQLQDHQTISVDGYKGEVFIHNDGQFTAEK